MNKTNFAIVTGASRGLGYEFAISLAKRNYNLLLVARDSNRLDRLRQKIESEISSAIKVIVFSCDLSNLESIDNLFKYIIDKEIAPNILINNAAIASYGEFAKQSQIMINECIDLNITAFTHLLYLFINLNTENKKYILNISSSYAFKSAENYAVYGASKAYIYNLSLSIRNEFSANTGISVFCPGKLDTDFDKHSGRVSETFIRGMNPSVASEYAINRMFSDKFLIIPGIKNKVLRLVSVLFPKLYKYIYDKAK